MLERRGAGGGKAFTKANQAKPRHSPNYYGPIPIEIDSYRRIRSADRAKIRKNTLVRNPRRTRKILRAITMIRRDTILISIDHLRKRTESLFLG